MARKPKSHAISGRVDDDYYENILIYIEHAELGMADLVRDAVKEYMGNHKIETETKND